MTSTSSLHSAGLTPPTTPPHKASQENPFKASLKTKLSSCSSSALACKRARLNESGPGTLAPAPGASGGGHPKRGPEQTELYAQLSKESAALPYSVTQCTARAGLEERQCTSSSKRTASRGHSDHDYCQASASAKKDSGTVTPTMTVTPGAPAGPVAPAGSAGDRPVECKDSAMPTSSPSSSSLCSHSSTSPAAPAKQQRFTAADGETAAVQGCKGKQNPARNTHNPLQDAGADGKHSPASSRKLLCDNEIRAELNKHFGHPLHVLYSQGAQEKETGSNASKATAPQFPSQDSDDSFFSQRLPGPSYLHPGFLPFHEDLELAEGRESRFLYPWEGTPLDLLFDCPPCSPSCSPPSSCSPSRGSVSPPSSLLLSPTRPFRWTGSRSRSRSRSHSGSRSSSLHSRRRSLSSSPDRHPSSW